MLYTSINIDLDQYKPFHLNKNIHISQVHIILTNPKTEGLHTIHSEIIAESLQQRACNLPNVEGILSFKHNDTPSKPIANFLNRFVNVYKSLEKPKYQ